MVSRRTFHWLGWSASLACLTLATASHAQEGDEQKCVPQCRAGYVCAEGKCVSACNPPCASDESCTAAGACVAKRAVTTANAGPTDESTSYTPAAAATSSISLADSPTETLSSTTSTGAHLHDGFYFRGGLGVGFVASGTVTPPGDAGDVSLSGTGPALELAFGGAVSPGVVLGGGIYGASVPSPSYSQGGVSVDGGSAVISSLGPFIDWYPNPHEGFHVQASIGYAVVTASKGSGDIAFPPKDQSGSGYSLLGGLGYEWWIADQLSFGVLARVQYVSASTKGSGDTDSTSVRFVVPALMGTITYQ